MKKLISVTLAAVMLFLTMMTPFAVYAGEDVKFDGPIMEENPLYTGEYKASGQLNGYTDSSKSKKYKNKTYYHDGYELYEQVRKKLDARSESFTIYYYATQRMHPNSYIEINTMRDRLLNTINNMVMGATEDELSKTSTDGDYARWSVSQYGLNDFDCDYTSSSYYLYTFDVAIVYYDSASQEAEVDKKVSSLVKKIRKENKSDYNILKEVHDYILNATTYADAALENPYNHTYAFSPYGALVKGQCVCQGYALAFYRICKELGYNVRFVSSDPHQGCHAWNLIEIDGKFYFVDCTWDDNVLDDGLDKEYPELHPHYYFLCDYTKLQSFDAPNVQQHLLYDELYDTGYFYDNYMDKVAEESYDETANETLVSSWNVALSKSSYVYTGKAIMPTVTVKNKNNVLLKKGTDYTVQYSKNTACGVAKVTINGLGAYKGMSTVRTFLITPAKAKTPSLNSDGRSTTSITVKWSKNAEAVDGYQVQVYKNGAWKTVKTVSSSTLKYKVTGLSPATKYQFRIRAYKTIDKIKYYGAYSSTYTTCTKPKTPSISLSTKSKSITVKWKKITTSGYQVQYSTNKNMKKAKTVKVKSSATSKKISKLKKGKKYYVRVRAYKTYTNKNGKKYTYYSSWSSKKSIKVK